MIADAQPWNKKTYNNAVSALRRAFAFGYCDHPEQRDPATSLQSARIGKKDRPAIDPFSIQYAETLIAALHRDWGEAQGNYDEFRFFTGLRPSEGIALVVSDYDPVHRVLSVTKARVLGLDKDTTKTAEDRRIELCPRAVAVLERQLRLRRRLLRTQHWDHEQLFVTDTGAPIRRLQYPYARWRRTLGRLAIRYRKPYAARHSSVSWDLMIGRNLLWVARQHGHGVATMLSVYAAWIEGSSEADVVAIREAMLIDLYWKVGDLVDRKIHTDGWGKGTVAALSTCLPTFRNGARACRVSRPRTSGECDNSSSRTGTDQISRRC